jgi:hypothetical protein
VPGGGGEETYILCRSTARKEKEQAIRSRFSARMEKALRGCFGFCVNGSFLDTGGSDGN